MELRLLEHDETVDGETLFAVEARLGQRPDVRVDVGRFVLYPDDRLLICSDGLSNELSSEEIRDVLAMNVTPRSATDRLITRANEHGGHDNITVIVVHVQKKLGDRSWATTSQR